MPSQLPQALQNEITSLVNETVDPATPQRTAGYFVLAVNSESTDPENPEAELKPLFWTSAGPRDVRIEGKDSRGPPAQDTRFAIYSCTKLLASLAVLSLLDDPRGKAKGFTSVDQRVDQWIPELSRDNKKVLAAWDDGAEPVWEDIQEGRDITVRMLLTHTSGVGYPLEPRLAKWGQSVGEALDTVSVEETFTTFPLTVQPGSEWHYGFGLDYASLLVNRITGVPLGQYLKERFFSKLGMKHTSFDCAELWDPKEHPTPEYPNPTTIADSSVGIRAHTHGKRGESFFASDPSLPLRTYDNGDNPVPGGATDTPNEHTPHFHMGGNGLWSTPSDYARLLSWLLRMHKAQIVNKGKDGEQLAKKESCPYLSVEAAELLFLPSTVGDEDGNLYTPLAQMTAMMNGLPLDAPETKHMAAHTCGAATLRGGPGNYGEPEDTIYWAGVCRQSWACSPSLDAAIFIGTFQVPPYTTEAETKIKRAFFHGLQKKGA
ncbi:hypothetical protein V8E36_002927 [Tilletia maclaganii]